MPGKGRGVISAAAIPAGTFVCEYPGEVLSDGEARARLKRYDSPAWTAGHALMVVRELLPPQPGGRLGKVLRSNIDATWRGSISRFFNHRLVRIVW
jgi:SET domain-containing protein